MKALVDLVAAERMEGRRVLVYATHTGTRDITERMDDMLTRHGFRVAVMKADAVAPERREAWVADRVKQGIDVMICHPRLVQMGLDLIDFPTIVWDETDYPVQPVYVEDVAAQAVEAGSQSENSLADTAGPDTFSFEALLRLLASSVGARPRLVHTPPSVGLALTGLVGLLMRDMALTRDEVDGLMAGLLTSEAAPTGTTRLADWLDDNADWLGRRYVSELRRNFRR